MGPGEHRPHDEQYWTPPWSTALFAGDLFEAIPLGDRPTTIHRAEDGKHFVGEVAFAYGLLTTQTWSKPASELAMRSQPSRTRASIRLVARRQLPN